jgi:hypothetical protein
MGVMDSDSIQPVDKVVPAEPRREVRPDGVWVEIDGEFVPEVPPDVRACFDQFDAFTEGMTPDEILDLLPDMYLDAEGFTRIRRQQIHAVPDPD